MRLINLRTAVTVAAYPYQGKPVGLRFSPDGKQLYLVTNSPARLTVFDTAVTVAPEHVDAFDLLCSPLR